MTDQKTDQMVENLPDQIRQLLERTQTLEKEVSNLRVRNAESEVQHQKLINLFVASQRLSQSLEVRNILETVNEIIINLVGSEQFGLYFVREDSETLPLELVCEVFQSGNLDEPPSAEQPEIRDALKTGKVRILDNPGGSPGAVIPLRMHDKVLVALVLYSILPQKRGFTETDAEIFELLAVSVGRAFYAAMMHSKNGYPENLADLLKGYLCQDSRFQ